MTEAKARVFIVKGLDPAGRVIETKVTGTDELTVKLQAEEAGLVGVVVTEQVHEDDK